MLEYPEIVDTSNNAEEESLPGDKCVIVGMACLATPGFLDFEWAGLAALRALAQDEEY